MLYYAWDDRLVWFNRFYRIEGKRVDVYSFTLSRELISQHNTIYNDRHD